MLKVAGILRTVHKHSSVTTLRRGGGAEKDCEKYVANCPIIFDQDCSYSVNWSIGSSMTSKLEPVIWLCVLVTLAYMKVRTYVRTDVHDVMAIKPNFLTSMGYHIFLTMVLRRMHGAPL